MEQILISDLHFGNAGDSQIHNMDLLDFFDWVIENANGIKQLTIMGDTFHNRHKLSLDTINYAIRGIEKLAEHFDRIIILVGNHDMFYRDTRETNSCSVFKHIKNVEVVENYMVEDDSVYVSWLCNAEEYDVLIEKTKKYKTKYMFSHMEFSTFQLNDHYEMVHGQSHKELKHLDTVFTGHYHGRQLKDNIVYIGTPFPYDFNDANDPNKGMCVFDDATGSFKFIDYSKVHVLTLSPEEILETDWSKFDLDDVTIRVVVEDDVSREVLDKITDVMETHDFRTNKLVYKPKTDSKVIAEVTGIDHLMSIDEAVLTHIKEMSDNDSVNKLLLEELYQEILQ